MPKPPTFTAVDKHVFCGPGHHVLRFAEHLRNGAPNLAFGRYCENCSYQDSNGGSMLRRVPA